MPNNDVENSNEIETVSKSNLEKLKDIFPQCFVCDEFSETLFLSMLYTDESSSELGWDYLSKRQELDAYEIDYSQIPLLSKKMQTFFCQKHQINLISFMNWRTSFHNEQRKQLIIIGKGYFDTAHFLLGECINNNQHKIADYWIFPILFNVVHGIEIYLKAINASGKILLDEDYGKIEGNHDILQICSTVQKKLELLNKSQHDSSTKEFLECIKVVKNFIKNIYDKTEDMTFARYPMDKQRNGHFYIEKLGNEVVDMVILFEQIPYVYTSLEYIFNRTDDYIDWKREFESEHDNYGEY